MAEIHAVLDVRRDDPRARLRVQIVVDVASAGLVLDERERILHLADVVVVRGHTHEQWIGPDRLGRALRQVPDHHRVVVGPRRFQQEAAKEPIGGIGELQELEHGHDPEQVAKHRERPHRQHHRQEGVHHSGAGELGDAGHIGLVQEAKRDNHRDVGECEHQPGPQEGIQALRADDRQQRGHAATEDVDGRLESRGIHQSCDHRQRSGQRRTGVPLQQDADQHHRGRGGNRIRPDGAIARNPDRHGADNQRQPKEQQGPIAVPDQRLEAPQEGDEQHRQQQDDQGVADDGRDLQARLGQAKLIELLEVELCDQVTGAHDDLVLANLDLHGVDLVPCSLLRLLGQRWADAQIGSQEGGGEVACQLAVRDAEIVGDGVMSIDADGVHVVFPHGTGLRRTNHRTCRRGNLLPVLNAHHRELADLRGRQMALRCIDQLVCEGVSGDGLLVALLQYRCDALC